MRPSSISIVSIDGYFSEILTYFGTGLFDYCTCGHCGWEIIVCSSVRSYHTYNLISIVFFHIDFPRHNWHASFGCQPYWHVGWIIVILIWESIHPCVCLLVVIWSVLILN